MEMLKLVVSILFGGAAGAFLNEWFRRRKGKVQSISLIERVNRLVSPELEGITLARLVGDGSQRRLEELTNLREYQLTLRNTSTVNLQNVEIQFEFPIEDIQAWASRPPLSKTALVLVEGQASEPWKRAFRWRIPHLPSDDSVEFTFRSVGSPSGDYEVALYNTALVIVEKVVGEPPPKARRFGGANVVLLASVIGVLVTVIVGYSVGFLVSPTGEEVSNVSQAGCELRVVSFYDPYGNGLRSPFRIKYRVFNVGGQGCVVQSAQLNPKGLFTILAGEAFEREWIIERAPRVIDAEVSVGLTNSTMKDAPIRIYVER
jgi:hypothetical protein